MAVGCGREAAQVDDRMTVIRDLPADQYHAMKALSAGVAWTFDSECPLKAWVSSPWNSHGEADNALHFDQGSAVHLAVLESHLFEERTVCHEFTDYRTKAAQAVRDAAYAAGQIPLRPQDMEMVNRIHDSLQRRRDIWSLFANCDSEVTMTWDWDGLPCKARTDSYAHDGSYMLDLKTAASVNPSAMERVSETHGWFFRAAWYLAGANEASQVLPERYVFVAIEKEPPYVVEAFEIDNRALVQAEQIMGRVITRFKECLGTRTWPTYSGKDGGVIKLARPSWAEFKFADREQAGDFC